MRKDKGKSTQRASSTPSHGGGYDVNGTTQRDSPYPNVPCTPSEDHHHTRRALREEATGTSMVVTQQNRGGEQQFFCNSSNARVEELTLNNIGRDMVIHNYYADLQRIEAVLRRLPQSVGFNDANALIITDPLGATLTLPWWLVPTLKDLHVNLVKHFQGKPGQRRIEEERYCIEWAAGEDSGERIMERDWARVLERGEQLVISMLIKQEEIKDAAKTCPKCGPTDLGTYRDEGWRVCRRCNTRFTHQVAPGYEWEREPEVVQGETWAFRNMRRCDINVPPSRPPGPVPFEREFERERERREREEELWRRPPRRQRPRRQEELARQWRLYLESHEDNSRFEELGQQHEDTVNEPGSSRAF